MNRYDDETEEDLDRFAEQHLEEVLWLATLLVCLFLLTGGPRGWAFIDWFRQ
jgi:hypothetical protein